MRYPILKKRNGITKKIEVFEGYQCTGALKDGEWSEMQNLSGREYPYLSTRPLRGRHRNAKACRGFTAAKKFCFLDGIQLRIGDHSMAVDLMEGEKEMLAFGKNLLIFPDGKYVDIDHPEKPKSISVRIARAGVELSLWKPDKTPLQDVYVGPSVPSGNLIGGERWLDISDKPYTLKVYDLVQLRWKITDLLETVYVRIYSEGIGECFEIDDAILIEHLDAVPGLNGIHIIREKDENALYIDGLIEAPVVQEPEAVFSRNIPTLKNLFVAHERLWGTQDITDENGNVFHRIYGSKKHDFRNFYYFGDTENDSYFTEFRYGGAWTGACAYKDEPMFFRENMIYRLRGKTPDTFRLESVYASGVAEGNAGTLAQTDGVLYYKGTNGIYLYEGGVPKNISRDIGSIREYPFAHAGAIAGKYYISIFDGEGKSQLLVYDGARNFWHREEGITAKYFSEYEGNLYFWNADTGEILSVFTERNQDSESPKKLHWYAVTKAFGLQKNDPRLPLCLQVTVRFPAEGMLGIEIEYGSTGVWELLAERCVLGEETVRIPIGAALKKPFRLRFSGTGEAQILSVSLQES